MAGLIYEERPDRMGLYLLEFRKLRGKSHRNKILMGMDGLDVGMLGNSKTRGHGLRIRGLDGDGGVVVVPLDCHKMRLLLANPALIAHPSLPRAWLRVNHITVGLESHVGQT
eukprot:g26551.t1